MNKLIIEGTNTGDELDWDNLSWEMNNLFVKVFPKKEVGSIAKGHGWRGLNGFIPVKKYNLQNDDNPIINCFPNGGECAFKIYEKRDKQYGHYLAINTVHHDSPIYGVEWSYIVRPKYMKENQNER